MLQKVLITLFLLLAIVYSVSQVNVTDKQTSLKSNHVINDKEANPNKVLLGEFVRLSDGSGYLRSSTVVGELPYEGIDHLRWPESKVIKVAMQIVRKTDSEVEFYKYINKKSCAHLMCA